ncbi:MAG: hypothetical protein WAU02_00820 [Candidatus Saccharimonadales bacterium]
MSTLWSVAQLDIKANEIGLPTIQASGSQLDKIFGLVYVALAAFAILFIIIAAMRMVVQGSDANAQKQSREAIIYAVVALGIATVVIAAIQFIVKSVGG